MMTNDLAGNYLAKVTDQYFGKSKRKGTLKFALGIRIFENLDNAHTSFSPLEREICWWISEKSLSLIMEDLSTLGYQGRTLTSVDPDTPGFHDFCGQEIEVSCGYEEDPDGKLWERWRLRLSHENLRDKTTLRQFD